jgi:hypothetical protein
MMEKVVTCPCGEVIRSSSDDEWVKLVGNHAVEVHNQPKPPREEVLAMAKPACTLVGELLHAARPRATRLWVA